MTDKLIVSAAGEFQRTSPECCCYPAPNPLCGRAPASLCDRSARPTSRGRTCLRGCHPRRKGLVVFLQPTGERWLVHLQYLAGYGEFDQISIFLVKLDECRLAVV